MNKCITLINAAGKGFLGGLGVGAVLFGFLFLSLSFSKGQSLNIGALAAIASGLACVFMALKFKKIPLKRINDK
ncbi:hypothetical protein [Catenovulum sediminis]|uniref:Uncharacterized protein n=1 Tax=Catenovulum sediminis TaxID=1740262 RepID=A0ABV1RIP9_9ALTE